MPFNTCIVCKKEFKCIQPHQKTCSKECRQERYARFHKRILGKYLNLPCLTVAVISELCVSVELLRKGYYVFRAFSTSSFCDLVAIKGKKIYQVEVRTGYKSDNGSMCFPRELRKTANLYAIWERHTGIIYYLDKNWNPVDI